MLTKICLNKLEKCNIGLNFKSNLKTLTIVRPCFSNIPSFLLAIIYLCALDKNENNDFVGIHWGRDRSATEWAQDYVLLLNLR